MKKTTKNMSMGISLGMCFGVALGSAFEKLGISMGLSIGMLIGLVIGTAKDKVVNAQIKKEGYTIKAIEKDDASGEYNITITNNQGKEQSVSVSVGTMETEQFSIGDG